MEKKGMQEERVHPGASSPGKDWGADRTEQYVAKRLGDGRLAEIVLGVLGEDQSWGSEGGVGLSELSLLLRELYLMRGSATWALPTNLCRTEG